MNTNENETVSLCIESPKRNFGKCKTYFFQNGEPLITIGPQWPLSLFMLFIMILAGIFLAEYTVKELSILLYVCTYISVLILITCFGFATLINPGICSQQIFENIHLEEENCDHIICGKCNICKRDKKAFHCKICDVCVSEWDHHCIWFGKCIAKYNVTYFRMFSVLAIIFFLFSTFINIHDLSY